MLLYPSVNMYFQREVSIQPVTFSVCLYPRLILAYVNQKQCLSRKSDNTLWRKKTGCMKSLWHFSQLQDLQCRCFLKMSVIIKIYICQAVTTFQRTMHTYRVSNILLNYLFWKSWNSNFYACTCEINIPKFSLLHCW